MRVSDGACEAELIRSLLCLFLVLFFYFLFFSSIFLEVSECVTYLPPPFCLLLCKMLMYPVLGSTLCAFGYTVFMLFSEAMMQLIESCN